MHHKATLCQPFEPFTEQPFLYNKLFLPGRIPVSLRPFHIAQDLTLVNHWFNFQFSSINDAMHDPFQYTEDYYATLLTGANSQPLLGFINQVPAFQVDIYQAMLGPDTLLSAGRFSNSDFIMQLMLSPDTLKNLSFSLYTVVSCLDCFFSYAEVDRLTWMINSRDKNFRFVAGIAELTEIASEDELQSFFIITKQQFKQVLYGLPLFPEEQEMAMER